MLNHIVIMGRLTRDPELRRTGSGIAVASTVTSAAETAAKRKPTSSIVLPGVRRENLSPSISPRVP